MSFLSLRNTADTVFFISSEKNSLPPLYPLVSAIVTWVFWIVKEKSGQNVIENLFTEKVSKLLIIS